MDLGGTTTGARVIRALAAIAVVVGACGAGVPTVPPAAVPPAVARTGTPTTAPQPTTTTAPPPATTPTPRFASSVGTVDEADLGASWHPGCPVPPDDLRAITVTHWDFGGNAVEGTVIVHREEADGVVSVFASLFEVGFPIERMVPVDAYGASDDRSMEANNTSGFNCRRVTGGSAWSEHSYGRAIDVNPALNPYIRGATVLPPAAGAYLDRTDVHPGMLVAGDDAVAAFDAIGWVWGGSWSDPDYQHFSSSGR